jgi:hypothetical protein
LETWFYPGEDIVLTLNADSDKGVFPAISHIAGYPVLGTSNAQSMSIVNTRRTIQNSKSYTFKPLQSLKIPAYTLIVDGSFSNQNILIPNVAEKKILILVEEKKLFDSEFLSYNLTLNSGGKNRALGDKKNYSNTLSGKKILNQTKNHNPPSS